MLQRELSRSVQGLALFGLGVVLGPILWVVVFYGSILMISMVTQDREANLVLSGVAQLAVLGGVALGLRERTVRWMALGGCLGYLALGVWFWSGAGR